MNRMDGKSRQTSWTERSRIAFAVVLSIAVLGAGAYFLRDRQNDSPAAPLEDASAGMAADAVADAGNAATDVTPAETGSGPETIRPDARNITRTAPAQPGPELPASTAVTIPHDTPMAEFKAELWEDIQANPPPLHEPGDPAVDADLAYRLYTYYGNCTMAAWTSRQFDRQLGRVEGWARSARARSLDRLEGSVDRMVGLYELCQAIPEDVDARMAAVMWMTEALQLGHEIAEVQYYDKVMGFMMRTDRFNHLPPLAMNHPGLVMQFQDTARLGLERALARGHPEAYVAKSRAVLEGMIYPRDPQLAYAYARAAELQAAKHLTVVYGIDNWKQAAAQYLDEEQVAEAERMALELRGERP